jgi:immunomodulating metalloprotease
MRRVSILASVILCLAGCGGEESTNESTDSGVEQVPVTPTNPDGEQGGDGKPSNPTDPDTGQGGDASISYTASAKVEGMGQILPTSLVMPAGQTGRFTLVPAPGHVIAEASGCGGVLKGVQYSTAAMSVDCVVTARFISNVALALQRQDHSLASADELINFARSSMADGERVRSTLVTTLYQGIDDISWHPSHDSVSFSSYLPTHTFNVLPANIDVDGKPSSGGLVMASEQDQRMVAMASSLFSVDTSPGTDKLLRQLIHWLTRGLDEVQGLSVVTAQLPGAETYWFPYNEKVRGWLNTQYPGYRVNAANSCDASALAGCIETHQPDLIILGNNDRQRLGFEGIAAAMAQAKLAGIPLILTNTGREASPMLAPLYQEMGLNVLGNYWPQRRADQLTAQAIQAEDAALVAVDNLLADLQTEHFDTAVLDNCGGNFLNCNDAGFATAFKSGADWLRNASISLDRAGRNPFDDPRLALLQASLLLADKYRSTIDYPIAWRESASWQQAMFADWLVSYARTSNQPQPDLGEFVIDARQLEKGRQAHYRYPATQSERKQIAVPYTDQWTTTGWYALPGQVITLTRHDSADVAVEVKLNYHRPNTNRAYEQKVYRAPLELATQRLTLGKGQRIQFSTPYGGPIYLNLSGSGAPLQVDVTAEGVAKHPTIMDFSSDAEIAAFEAAIRDNELPHVDLRTDGAEQHLRRDRFLGAIDVNTPDVKALLRSIASDHINAVYTLAGFKIQGKTLAESLPGDVQAICGALFGQDCLDETLNTRRTIQHANYDQNAQCGSGCSGNPWDASWNISPTGWGDNHELGHNLQTNKLNVQYASDTNRDNWSGYGSRAGENSNNIFPYVVQWRTHYLRDGNTAGLPFRRDGFDKGIFFAWMSDAAGVTDAAGNRVVLDSACRIMDAGADRYTAPWQSNAYAVHNDYRMGFYIQMALRANGMVFADGTALSNGFDIFTLLYQHGRIFDKYATDVATWDAHRDQLGFGLFSFSGDAVYGGKSVASIPGNDFMLVSLSKLTGFDWAHHFDMLGLRYTRLAAQQAVVNGNKGKLPMGLYDLAGFIPPMNLTQGLRFLPLLPTDSSLRWSDGSSPSLCPKI